LYIFLLQNIAKTSVKYFLFSIDALLCILLIRSEEVESVDALPKVLNGKIPIHIYGME